MTKRNRDDTIIPPIKNKRIRLIDRVDQLPIDVLCVIANFLPDYGLFALRHTSKIMASVEYTTVRKKWNGVDPQFPSAIRGPIYSVVAALRDGFTTMAHYLTLLILQKEPKGIFADADTDMWHIFTTAVHHFTGDFSVINTLWDSPVRIRSCGSMDNGRALYIPERQSTMGANFIFTYMDDDASFVRFHRGFIMGLKIARLFDRLKPLNQTKMLVSWFKSKGITIGHMEKMDHLEEATDDDCGIQRSSSGTFYAIKVKSNNKSNIADTTVRIPYNRQTIAELFTSFYDEDDD